MKPHGEASRLYTLQEEQRAVLFITATFSNNTVMYLVESRLEKPFGHEGERGLQMH